MKRIALLLPLLFLIIPLHAQNDKDIEVIWSNGKKDIFHVNVDDPTLVSKLWVSGEINLPIGSFIGGSLSADYYMMDNLALSGYFMRSLFDFDSKTPTSYGNAFATYYFSNEEKRKIAYFTNKKMVNKRLEYNARCIMSWGVRGGFQHFSHIFNDVLIQDLNSGYSISSTSSNTPFLGIAWSRKQHVEMESDKYGFFKIESIGIIYLDLFYANSIRVYKPDGTYSANSDYPDVKWLKYGVRLGCDAVAVKTKNKHLCWRFGYEFGMMPGIVPNNLYFIMKGGLGFCK